VEAERGFSHSLRADSALYLHLFFDSLLLAACFVLGLAATHWVIVALALTMMLSAELFAQGLTALASEVSDSLRKQVNAIATAAKTLALVGSTSAISIVLLHRFRELFAG
jgi:diacylglycerol kinase